MYRPIEPPSASSLGLDGDSDFLKQGEIMDKAQQIAEPAGKAKKVLEVPSGDEQLAKRVEKIKKDRADKAKSSK